MTHDPMCWLSEWGDLYKVGHLACECTLIAKVRADERAKYVLPDLPRGGEHVDYCRDLACCGCEEITEGVIAQML